MLIAVATAFSGAELYIRLCSPAGYITPAILWDRSFKVVPSVFSRSILPQEAQIIRSGSRVLARINSRGYRGSDFKLPKPKETTRVLIYGGSSVFDIHAEGDEDWPHQTEKLLKTRGFARVEVINAGILGHASYDCLGRLFAEGHLFEPDYVILYNGWNDIKDFASEEPLLRRLKPLAENPLYPYQNRLDKFFCEYSQLYVRLRYRFLMHKYRVGLEGSRPLIHASKLNQTALRQYRITLETFVDLTRNAGAIPVLALEAHLIHPENSAREKRLIAFDAQPFTSEAVLEGINAIEITTREVAREKKALFLNTSNTLSGKMRYFKDHVHTSAEGSKVLAKITADFLESVVRSDGFNAEQSSQ